MSDQDETSPALPVTDCLKFNDQGEPYLEGFRCKSCEAVYTKPRLHCANCAARDAMEPYRLSNSGRLHTYSIVQRSFPGIEVPFISAVVDLDGGGTLKGNLIEVAANPESIEFNMPVKMVFGDALGRKDKEGNSYLSYFFAPA